MNKERRSIEQTQKLDRSQFMLILNQGKADAISRFNELQSLEIQVLEAESLGLIIDYFAQDDGTLGAKFRQKNQMGFRTDRNV